MMSSGVDLTERRAAEEQIAYLAYHDSLTGLPNRALLQEHLDLALARARRQGEAVGLLYLDLDGFKLVNDSLGHPAGDELLCHVTMRLSERRRGMDLLARQGGDEFLLLLADLERPEAEAHARRVAEDLLEALAEPFSISGAEFHIGASIGDLALPARRRRRRRAAAPRRRRDVRREVRGPQRRHGLQRRSARAAGAPVA